MKKLYTVLFINIIMAVLSLSYADSTTYGKVLFRVNTGGVQEESIDTSDAVWITDNYLHPCPYIDTNAMGNKVYLNTGTVTPDASVPASTPAIIFQTERTPAGWDVPALEYNFPIEAGQKVEVRLYFAEFYYDNANARVFDIMVEGEVKQANFDIYNEVGKNVGLMKKFIVTSDGNLDIDMKKIIQLPKIDGIEIIAINTVGVQGLFAGKSRKVSIAAYPNPFTQEVTLDLGNTTPESLQVYDSYGREIPVGFYHSGSVTSINLSNYPKGIYYLRAAMSEYKMETIKLIKE